MIYKSGIYESGMNENVYYYNRDIALENNIREICREEINIAIPQLTAAIAKEVENGVLSAFSYDVQTIADVGVGNIEEMINKEKISSFVSVTIAEEVNKRIKNVKINIH